MLQIFVSGIDIQPSEYGNKDGRNHDHREWQAEVVLHKAHTIGIGLSRTGEKGNGTGLCGHNAQQYGVPGHLPSGHNIRFAACPPALVQTIDNNGHKAADHNDPVYITHWYIRVKRVNNKISTASHRIRARYQLRQ
ncbi:hypothetical protein FQZ97_940230 [compost metagenome]